MDVLKRNLLFVSGKGGVGKTVVSQAIAHRLNKQGKRVLWATFEDPLMASHELQEVRPGLFHVNCEASLAFEEYAAMKIGIAGLAKIFLQNKVMRYLSKAAPGIHELVLLGKVWHERNHYDHVVIDMPSTGYGLVMFNSTKNFSELFKGGPIHRDAESMLATFCDPVSTGQLIVSLPEEMPLRESIELNDYILNLFPKNQPQYLVNRIFPTLTSNSQNAIDPDPDHWKNPLAENASDYILKRNCLEKFNLRIWDQAKIKYQQLSYEPPLQGLSSAPVIEKLSQQLEARGYL
jgi:anion-transporting  ArsA/GET3 family ATPase